MFVKLFVIFGACAEQIRVRRERNEDGTQPGIYHIKRGDPNETITQSGTALHKGITSPVTCSICSPLLFKAQMRSDILLQEPVNLMGFCLL